MLTDLFNLIRNSRTSKNLKIFREMLILVIDLQEESMIIRLSIIVL
jgi:hypothetical protein